MMQYISRSALVVLALLAWGSVVSAVQDAAESDQMLQFEESVVVTATPRSGSATEYFLNFSSPVHVPGVTLGAGTYVFRFPDPGAKVIQVLKADRSEAYTMFHTIPVIDVTRDLSSDAHQVTWKERTPDAPPAITAWFPPGKMTGYEFVYPEAAGN